MSKMFGDIEPTDPVPDPEPEPTPEPEPEPEEVKMSPEDFRLSILRDIAAVDGEPITIYHHLKGSIVEYVDENSIKLSSGQVLYVSKGKICLV